MSPSCGRSRSTIRRFVIVVLAAAKSFCGRPFPRRFRAGLADERKRPERDAHCTAIRQSLHCLIAARCPILHLAFLCGTAPLPQDLAVNTAVRTGAGQGRMRGLPFHGAFHSAPCFLTHRAPALLRQSPHAEPCDTGGFTPYPPLTACSELCDKGEEEGLWPTPKNTPTN
jgi:hypothetical protein